jgi:hypothetical protein
MESYRYKVSKGTVKARHIKYRTNEMDGSHKEVDYWEVAIGGDFRKGYITYSNKEFEETFERN